MSDNEADSIVKRAATGILAVMQDACEAENAQQPTLTPTTRNQRWLCDFSTAVSETRLDFSTTVYILDSFRQQRVNPTASSASPVPLPGVAKDRRWVPSDVTRAADAMRTSARKRPREEGEEDAYDDDTIAIRPSSDHVIDPALQTPPSNKRARVPNRKKTASPPSPGPDAMKKPPSTGQPSTPPDHGPHTQTPSKKIAHEPSASPLPQTPDSNSSATTSDPRTEILTAHPAPSPEDLRVIQSLRPLQKLSDEPLNFTYPTLVLKKVGDTEESIALRRY